MVCITSSLSRDISRWSSFDIWDQNANIWALKRNSSGLHRLVPERLQNFSLLKCLISSLAFPHPFVDFCCIFFLCHQQKVWAYRSMIRPDNYQRVSPTTTTPSPKNRLNAWDRPAPDFMLHWTLNKLAGGGVVHRQLIVSSIWCINS